MRRRNRLGLLVAAALGVLFMLTAPNSTAFALDPAPDLTVNSVTCYRSIVQTGDLFCLTRYELPTKTSADVPVSPEAWCAELVNQAGCTDDPVVPDEPTSLIPDSAFATLYTGSTLEDQTRVPRIDHGIAGNYLEPGHAVTWGDASVEGCVESSATLYSTQSQSCIPVVWNTADNTQAEQREQLGDDLVSQIRAIESLRSLPLNSLVTNNLITTAGRTLALEALNVVDRIVPGVFQAAAERAVTEGFATPSADTALQASLDATATAGEIPTAFAQIGSDLGGLSAGAMATIFFIGVGVVLFVFLHGITQEWVIPSVGLLSVAMVGVFVRGPSVSVIAVTALLLVFVGSMWFLRRVPH